MLYSHYTPKLLPVTAIKDKHMRPNRNKERLSVMVTANRLKKLRALALQQDKTMTQLIEDWIDSLPTPTEYDISITQQAS